MGISLVILLHLNSVGLDQDFTEQILSRSLIPDLGHKSKNCSTTQERRQNKNK